MLIGDRESTAELVMLLAPTAVCSSVNGCEEVDNIVVGVLMVEDTAERGCSPTLVTSFVPMASATASDHDKP
jgi:hypothetical protein